MLQVKSKENSALKLSENVWRLQDTRRECSRQAGRHAVRRPREQSVADAGAGNSPSQLRASVFCLSFSFCLEAARVVVSLDHSAKMPPTNLEAPGKTSVTMACKNVKLQAQLSKMLAETLPLNTSQLLLVLASFARVLASRYQFQDWYYEHKPRNKTRTDTKQQKCETKFPRLESVVKFSRQSATMYTREDD